MKLLRVLLVDSDPLQRQALLEALREDPGLDACGAAGPVGEALRTCESLAPADVLVLAIDGLPMARARDWAAVHFLLPGVPIVALTTGEKSAILLGALTAGVLGLHRPNVAGAGLRRAVRRAARGKVDRDSALVERAERLLAPPTRQRPVTIGGLLIDLDRQLVAVAGEKVRLTELEFRLLAHMVRSRGRPVGWAELVEQVWGMIPGQGGTPDQVRGLLKRLRRKITRGGAGAVLSSVRGRGYVLVPPEEVERQE